MGSASYRLEEQLSWSLKEVCSQWRLGLVEQLRVLAYLAACRNALRLADWAFQAGLADMSNYLCCSSGWEETALRAFYYCEGFRSFWSHVEEWTARIDPKQLVVLDVGYVVDNADPPYRGEKRVVVLTIPVVARMVIWET